MTKVISFSSGKGGVGKTSVVVNLGCLFASQGKKTLLIDGDWSLGKLSIMLGVQPRWTVEKALRGEITLEETVQPVQKNLSLLASPTGLLGFEEMSETERNQLYFEIESLSDQFDLILFDHGSGVSWGVTQFAAASHQNVIVTTCEPTSYTDAYAIMKILSRRFAVREFSLLVTMSPDHAETARVIERFREMATSHLQIRLSLLDVLPWEAKMGESIRKQQPFVELFPQADLTSRFDRICRKLGRRGARASHGLSFFYQSNLEPLSMG